MSAAVLDGAVVQERAAKQALWDAFCAAHGVAEAGVPLFATGPDSAVEVFGYGRDGRPMLRRSAAMGELLAGTVERVLASAPGEAEGVLYLMHRLDEAGRVVPLCVGKAGRYGRSGGVSANLASIRTDAGKFARWGYNYTYHLGDLSAAALPGHVPGKVVRKYQRCDAPVRRRTRGSTMPARARALLVHGAGAGLAQHLGGIRQLSPGLRRVPADRRRGPAVPGRAAER